ncbi:MAG: asparagine synthase (glutamine-hydrolyzing) [Bacteroidota bacterium]
MCGIAGIVGIGDKEILKTMTDSLAHRGPDDSGIEWFGEDNCGLGHRRLSILDLSHAGHQPMCNDSGKMWITLNGEVYNYKDIRSVLEQKGYSFRSNSDTEVILKSYEEWGPASLERFNGMFAYAIYDTERKTLFAARDRLGVKPFYYCHQNGHFVFASEIKALLASKLVETGPDYTALHTPTRFQISPLTGFENIFKLPAGHYLKFEKGSLNITKYWDISPSEDLLVEEQEAEKKLDGLLQDSVRLQMIADVPVGVLLSGGLDSSIISALMRKNTEREIHSFTIRFGKADQKLQKIVDDGPYAWEVAHRFGFRHHELEVSPDIQELLSKMVWHMDEPIADPAAINTYLISKAARELGIVVLLNGMGGDEIFGGYPKQLACLSADYYQLVVPRFLQSLIRNLINRLPVATATRGLRSIRSAKRFLSYASLNRIDRFLASDLSLSAEQYGKLFANGTPYYSTPFYRHQAPVLSQEHLSYLTKMCLTDTKVFLADHNLTYNDKASMAVGVEGRPPLTDHRLVELMFSLGPHLKIRGTTQKYLLKKVSQQYLPKSIVYRPKAPFASPLRAWIRGPLAPMVDDLLSEESLRKRGLYQSEYVSNVIQSDRKGIEDNSQLIWTLLTNEIWFRTFFP